MSSNTSGEGEIRKNIIEADIVDCMVALPSQLFYNTMIPACLWFAARDKKNHKFRDRRGEGGKYEDVPGFCMAVKLDEIRKHGHILTPGRYVGAEEVEEDGEPFEEKMARLTVELAGQFEKSSGLEGEIRKNLAGLGFNV